MAHELTTDWQFFGQNTYHHPNSTTGQLSFSYYVRYQDIAGTHNKKIQVKTITTSGKYYRLKNCGTYWTLNNSNQQSDVFTFKNIWDDQKFESAVKEWNVTYVEEGNKCTWSGSVQGWMQSANSSSDYYFPNGSTTDERYFTLNFSNDKKSWDIALPTLYNRSVNINVSPYGGGTVTGNGTYYQGDSVTVTATANSNYVFDAWYENDTVVSTDASYTFTMPGTYRTLTAKFKRLYTLNLRKNINDAGDVSQTGSGTYLEGDSTTIIALTNDGYIFYGWYVWDYTAQSYVKLTLSPVYQYTMPASNMFIQAKWVVDTIDEYDRLDYIESTGTQYINTGINLVTAGTTDCEIQVDVERTTDRISDNTLFGLSNDNSNTYNCRVFANYGSGISMWNNSSDPRTVSFTDIYPNDEIKHLTFNQTSTTLSLTDGIETVSQTVTAATTSKLYLLSSYSAERSCGNFKLYSAKIKVNNVLVRDFIPARRKIDSILGLYDLVENKFYINDGPGEDFKTGIYKIGEKRDFSYITGGTISSHEAQKGSVQSFRIDKTGLYKLEVIGGKGGLSSQKTGYSGDGGYSYGYKVLSAGNLVYVACGGGLNATFNGGGYGNKYDGAYGVFAGNGGGATHIATIPGTLESIGASNLDKVLIVAGGGGGQGETYISNNISNYKTGGAGGGLTGSNASYPSGTGSTNYYGIGGTQTQGYAYANYSSSIGPSSYGVFGKGGSAESGGDGTSGASGNPYEAGGGGGGLYGGGAGGWAAASNGVNSGAGAGGSGYIGGVPEIIYKGTTYTPETIQGGVTSEFDYVNYDGRGHATLTLLDMSSSTRKHIIAG